MNRVSVNSQKDGRQEKVVVSCLMERPREKRRRERMNDDRLKRGKGKKGADLVRPR